MRHALIAAGACMALGLASQSEAQPNANTAGERSSAVQEIASTAAVDRSQEAAANSASPYKPSCNEPRDAAEYGSCAEAATIVPAWFEVIGLLLTLFFTGWAARAAGRSARAAEIAISKSDEILTHSKESSERELRAYVFPFAAHLLDGSLAKPVIRAIVNHPGVHFVARNSGQTPAYRAVVYSDFKVMETRYEETGLTIPPIPQGYERYALAPNGDVSKTHRHPHALTKVEMDGIKAGTTALYIYGRAEYTDAFKRPRFTNFRLKYTGAWPPNASAQFLYCDNGNEAD
jgi:hypothetical protein